MSIEYYRKPKQIMRNYDKIADGHFFEGSIYLTTPRFPNNL